MIVKYGNTVNTNAAKRRDTKLVPLQIPPLATNFPEIPLKSHFHISDTDIGIRFQPNHFQRSEQHEINFAILERTICMKLSPSWEAKGHSASQ
jgi:hypothetical protein